MGGTCSRRQIIGLLRLRPGEVGDDARAFLARILDDEREPLDRTLAGVADAPARTG